MNSKNPQKGFTILVAVITAGILLIVAMSIGGVALKEQILSTTNKESQIAFYAADTGIECAMYWDLNSRTGGIFAPDSDGNSRDSTNPPGSYNPSCGGVPLSFSGPSDVVPSLDGTSHAEYTYTFEVSGIPVGDPKNNVTTCAIVTITKDTNDNAKYNPSPGTPSGAHSAALTHTDIYSYGYNTCDASLNRLERGIEAHY